MSDDLCEIFERLDYAVDEIDTLERHLQHFMQNHFEVATITLPHGQQLVARCKVSIPTRIHSRVKAVAHEIRASLDSLACVLAQRNGNTTSGVYFPVTKTEEFFETDAPQKLKKLSGPDRDKILAMKTHGTARPFFYGMHDLDRMGKHHRLALSRIATGGGIQIDGPGNLTGMQYHGDVVVNGNWQPIATLAKGSNITLKVGMKVEFVEPPQLAGLHVVDALKRFLDEAREVITEFA